MLFSASTRSSFASLPPPNHYPGQAENIFPSAAKPLLSKSRRAALISSSTFLLSSSLLSTSSASLPLAPPRPVADFSEIPGSGGVKSLDIRIGQGESPAIGDQIAIHYYGRLAAKQGWRFDSTYEHKDESGVPVPFVFTVGSGKVISGIEAAVKTMKLGGVRRVIIPPSQGYQNTSQEPIPPDVISGIEAAVKTMKLGGVRRVIIPPSQGYQNTSQEPIPPDFFDRQRLFTTIFNPTRLANGEGSTLGTLVFDIELVSLRHL